MGRRGGRVKKAELEREQTSSKSVSSSTSEDDNVEFDPDKLSIVVEGHSKSFSEWTLEYAHHYYPNVGYKTYRVPPLEFNTQPLTDDIQLGFAQLGAQKEDTRKKDRSQADVGFMFEGLGIRLERSAEDGKGLFIVGSAQYDNYLSDLKVKGIRTKGRQPPLPKEVAHRGELDLLVLHSKFGIILVQVKGVGFHDSWQPTKVQLQGAVQKKVKEAEAQLKRDEVVLHHIMKDLHLLCDVHRVVALPFVTRRFLQECYDEESDEPRPRPVYLCSEDMASSDAMFSWWMSHIVHDQCMGLSDFQLQSIVGRYCGLLSTVSVWCKSSQRVEVRDVAEAADEVGARFANLVLTTQQRNVLDCQEQLVYLHGPPGAGKSVMLVIKARQWLLEGHDVVVLNFDFGQAGNPIGYYIHDSISQWLLKNVVSASVADDKPGCEKVSSEDVGVISADSTSDGKHHTKAKTSKNKSKCTTSNVQIADSVNTIPAHQIAAKHWSVHTPCGNELSQANCVGVETAPPNTESCSADFSSCSASSSSDTENIKSKDIGHVFRIDLDLGMNLWKDEFSMKLTGLTQQIKQLIRPGVMCHFVWDEFYWKDRLLPVMDELRHQFPDSCIWCAELDPDKAPRDFTKIMLNTVLRCPPTVQALLQRVDWREAHKALYTVDSTKHGLPSDGFKPKLIRHEFHQAVSPLDCLECADILLNFFHEELKLDFGSNQDTSASVIPGEVANKGNPGLCPESDNMLPSSTVQDRADASVHCQPKTFSKTLSIPKAKKKKSYCTPRRVKFRDIVVMFSYPRECITRTNNLLIVKETLRDHHHDNIKNSIFLRHMKAAGLRVTFRAPNSDAQEIALPMEDEVLFTVTNAVIGLERKVVIYVPCESKMYKYPVEKHLESPTVHNVSASQARVQMDLTPENPRAQHENPFNMQDSMDAAVVATEDHHISNKTEKEKCSASTKIYNVENDNNSSELTPAKYPVQVDGHTQLVSVPVSEIPPQTAGGGRVQTKNIPEMSANEASVVSKLEGAQVPLHIDMSTCHVEHRDCGSQEASLPIAVTQIGTKEKPREQAQGEVSQQTCKIPVTAENCPFNQTSAMLLISAHSGCEGREDRVSREPVTSVTSGLSEEDWSRIEERMLEQNQTGMFYAASRCLSVFVLVIP